MGLPSENGKDYTESSPVTYAKNLEGNLMLIHGSGDDNVHYQNCEFLINELVKQNKMFSISFSDDRTKTDKFDEPTQFSSLFCSSSSWS